MMSSVSSRSFFGVRVMLGILSSSAITSVGITVFMAWAAGALEITELMMTDWSLKIRLDSYYCEQKQEKGSRKEQFKVGLFKWLDFA